MSNQAKKEKPQIQTKTEQEKGQIKTTDKYPESKDFPQTLF